MFFMYMFNFEYLFFRMFFSVFSCFNVFNLIDVSFKWGIVRVVNVKM